MRRLILVTLMLLPLNAQAETLMVGGKAFNVPQPQGMCDLDTDNQSEAIFAEVIRSGNVGANDVVKVFADCKQLKALRADERNDLTYYGSISIPQTGDKYQGSRAEYIEEARTALKQKEQLLGAMGISKAKAAGNKALEDQGMEGLGIASADFLGEVSASGESVQIGTVQTNKSPNGANKKVAGVATMSLIKGEQIVVNMHALYEGKKTTEALQKYADRYYGKLIKAND